MPLWGMEWVVIMDRFVDDLEPRIFLECVL